MIEILEEVQPWLEPARFGAIYGGVAGGIGGSLGGVLGAAAGTLAPKGKGRRLVVGGFWALLIFGLLNLCFAGVALMSGQPYGIWYPPLICGFVLSIVCGSLIPVVNRVYAASEKRRMDAADLRS